MSQANSPIPLIFVGRMREIASDLAQSLAPHFICPAIIDFTNYNPNSVRVLLATLNPYPAGILVGGGLSLEVQQEVERVVQEHNKAGRYGLKLACIPVGTREKSGVEGVKKAAKEALGREFGVSW